jgi:hypothetical protein
MLLALWSPDSHCITRDLDLLGLGQLSEGRLLRVFREICLTEVEPDGLSFDTDSLRTAPIRGEEEYLGVRVRLGAVLVKATIPLQVDVGFGDAVVPEALMMVYPALLDFPAPRLRVYPPEAVIAEKLQAMVELDMLNSRLKDYHDIYTLSRLFSFDGRRLGDAIRATFGRRATQIPAGTPRGLSAEFAGAEREVQWTAFLRRVRLPEDTVSLAQKVVDINAFLSPVLTALRDGRELMACWPAGGPWST